MEKKGIIERVEEPTDWCVDIVPVLKSNNTVRISVDLTKLNMEVRRERHIMPSVEQLLASLRNAKVFT